ncbi:MAG: hypothetical protein V1908_03030 [Candidatus Peregrinibacteria bacterium]
MNSELFDIIIPSLAFFIAFFLAYSMVEILIILLLNRMIFHTWDLTPEKWVQSKELYKAKIKIVTLLTIILLIGLLIYFTDFLTILFAATLEIQTLAAETLLAMILIYLTTTRKLTREGIERSIHKYLYIYMSVIVFTFTITLADSSYGHYKEFINANVTTTIRGVEKTIESREKTALVENFRKQIYQGQCTEINFLNQPQKTTVTNFVYITTNDDLIRAETTYEEDPDVAKDLRGRLCTDGIQTFLLTDHGRWYWVIES